MNWRMVGHSLRCGPAALVMGIINVTPDSFYDGGRHADAAAAVDHALRLVDEGADIIDVGGESSRPPVYGEVRAVASAEECARVVPVIRAVRRQSQVPVSVDTVKSAVAARALDAGAAIINDISALSADPDMVQVAARSGAGVVLMHMRGTPGTMQRNTQYADVVGEVENYLRTRMRVVVDAGIAPGCLAVDPGLGFGKSVAGNLELIAGLRRLTRIGRPLLVGASRKSFIWKPQGLRPADALEGSLAAAVISVVHGAHILRVHDVKATIRAVRVAEMIQGYPRVAETDGRDAA